MSKITLPTVTNGQDLTNINNNFALIAAALNNNVFYRTNISGEPNTMSQDVDFNGFKAYNVSDIQINGVSFLATVNAQVAIAQAAVTSAQTAASQSAASAGSSQVSAQAANASAVAAAASAAASGTLKQVNNLSDLASVSVAKTNLGLDQVNNTSDANKPISTAQASAIALKLNAVTPIASGSFTVNGNAATVISNDTGGGQANYALQRSGVNQWSFILLNTSNDLGIARFASGVYQSSPISIVSSSGDVIIQGRTVNVTPSAGQVGEVMEFISTAAITLTSGTINNMGGGLTLTPGIWEVSGSFSMTSSVGSWTIAGAGITNTGAFDVFGTYVNDTLTRAVSTTVTYTLPTVRKAVTVNTSCFGVLQIGGSNGTGQVKLHAVRIQ